MLRGLPQHFPPASPRLHYETKVQGSGLEVYKACVLMHCEYMNSTPLPTTMMALALALLIVAPVSMAQRSWDFRSHSDKVIRALALTLVAQRIPFRH